MDDGKKREEYENNGWIKIRKEGGRDTLEERNEGRRKGMEKAR